MAALRSAVSALALYDAEANDMSPEANLRKAIKLQAQNADHRGRIRADPRRQGTDPPKSGVSIAHNFLYMLTGKEPDEVAVQGDGQSARAPCRPRTERIDVRGARHRRHAVGHLFRRVTSAIGTLKGPLHGGANEAVMVMLEEIGSIDNVETYIMNKLANKEKIMGFGHRVYKNGDPRAKHLQKMSRELGRATGNMSWYNMSVKIEELVTGQKGLKPNVDFYSASVYTSLGIPRDLFTPIFAISRVSGWTAHILEQYADNRLIRPRAEYVGPTEQSSYVPIDERHN